MNEPHSDQPESSSPDVMWSIAEVERDTGLGKDTLRVWERRYGFPTPLRDANGERAYPHAQVQRLRVIKRLLDAGHRPGKVVSLTVEQLELLARADASAAEPRVVSPGEAGSGLADVHGLWLRWLMDNRTDLIRQALQQQILRQGLGVTVEQLVAPLCVLVGETWLRGELSVYQEHLFTEVLQTVLREAIAGVDAGGQSLQRPPRVLLTTTPPEQHGLGLLMAECFFALESCERLALGISTPLADIVQATRQLQIDVVALSFSAHASRRDVIDSLEQLADQLPSGVEIWAGGAAMALNRRGIPDRVTVLRRASDVTLQVQAWRMRHGAARAWP